MPTALPYAIVERWTTYCPITDGISGSRSRVHARCATRDGAQAMLNLLAYDLLGSDPDPDVDLYIEGPPPPPLTQAQVRAMNDEIPF